MTGVIEDAEAVEQRIEALVLMGLDELRQEWRLRWGAPPKLRSQGLLRQIIAWRIQSDVYGGLDGDLRARLRSRSMPRRPLPPMGSRLAREYQGRVYRVEIVERGVLFEGRQYGSLSEVAREITGTRWNGPKFFGLRGGVQ